MFKHYNYFYLKNKIYSEINKAHYSGNPYLLYIAGAFEKYLFAKCAKIGRVFYPGVKKPLHNIFRQSKILRSRSDDAKSSPASAKQTKIHLEIIF